MFPIETGQHLCRVFKFFYQKSDRFWSFCAFSKKLKLKWNFLGNHGKNIFWLFYILPLLFHHKWKRTGLLSLEGEYASCIMSSPATFTKLGIFKKIPNMFGFDEKALSLPPKPKRQKISCKAFHRKSYVTLFCEFVCKIFSKVVAVRPLEELAHDNKESSKTKQKTLSH